MMKKVLEHVRRGGTKQGLNVVAFSGGVDSSLVAALVNQIYPHNSVACLGVSAALPLEQLHLARNVANHIGIPLWETKTTEGEDPQYVENKGKSCYHCKTNLYTTLQGIVTHVQSTMPMSVQNDYMDRNLMNISTETNSVVLFNGTNADDKLDPTRLGLIAASEFDVVSPLEELCKDQVRQLSKEFGLPNWNYAASPCLRSRLAFGVEATTDHLKRVERAEDGVRKLLNLNQEDNMRVRFLARNRAAIELDLGRTNNLTSQQIHNVEVLCRDIGFDDAFIRPFKSGSVSGFNRQL